MTDDDGRVRDLAPDGLGSGVHRLVFAPAMVRGRRPDRLLPRVPVVFDVTDTGRHYHVPLLLSPYAYSTYRGS